MKKKKKDYDVSIYTSLKSNKYDPTTTAGKYNLTFQLQNPLELHNLNIVAIAN